MIIDSQLFEVRFVILMTQCQIASVLGISQVQVSRIEKKVLDHMRNVMIE